MNNRCKGLDLLSYKYNLLRYHLQPLTHPTHPSRCNSLSHLSTLWPQRNLRYPPHIRCIQEEWTYSTRTDRLRSFSFLLFQLPSFFQFHFILFSAIFIFIPIHIGSSLRVQVTLDEIVKATNQTRIIPACAGNIGTNKDWRKIIIVGTQ